MRSALVLSNWGVGDEVDRLVDLAVEAEASGWDGVFLADHLIFPPPREIGAPSKTDEFWPMADPWVTLAAIAARTTTITLGTWITPIPRRQPWQLARDVATLDRLSHGRVLLGVGLGRRPDYELFGRPWDFPTLAEQTDESLELIDRLWTGESVTHHGAHYDVDEVTLLPTPYQKPRVPVVVGGLWPRKGAVRRGARWDGIMTHFPGDRVLPQDGTPPEVHAAAMVEFYLANVETPGEIFLPAEVATGLPEWREIAAALGATWLWHGAGWTIDEDMIRSGPPST